MIAETSLACQQIVLQNCLERTTVRTAGGTIHRNPGSKTMTFVKILNLKTIKIKIMLKSMIKTVLLVLTTAFIAVSVKELSFIYAIAGGICAGIYNNVKD